MKKPPFLVSKLGKHDLNQLFFYPHSPY